MGVRKLDRDRYYAVVYGDPKRAFYQDGIFFSADGAAVDGKDGPVEKVTSEDPPVVVEQAKKAAPKIDLNGMHITKLKRLAEQVNAQTGEPLPEGGAGAKARLVKYILDNTE